MAPAPLGPLDRRPRWQPCWYPQQEKGPQRAFVHHKQLASCQLWVPHPSAPTAFNPLKHPIQLCRSGFHLCCQIST